MNIQNLECLLVAGLLSLAIGYWLRFLYVAKRRASDLVSQARKLMAAGVFSSDMDGNLGPAELLGDAYRLQRQAFLKAEDLGLKNDAELDELIITAIRGNAPVKSAQSTDERDTLVDMPLPRFLPEDEEPTLPGVDLDALDAASDPVFFLTAGRNRRNVRIDDYMGYEEYLEYCGKVASSFTPVQARKDTD